MPSSEVILFTSKVGRTKTLWKSHPSEKKMQAVSSSGIVAVRCSAICVVDLINKIELTDQLIQPTRRGNWIIRSVFYL